MSTNGKSSTVTVTRVTVTTATCDDQYSDDDQPTILHVSWKKAFNPFSSKCVYVNEAKNVYAKRIQPWLPSCTEARSRYLWVATNLSLATVNLVLNILNFVYFSVLPLDYGLVIAGPSFVQWVLLCIFTSFSCCTFVCVCLNTISVFRPDSAGQPRLGLHYELLIILPIEYIPLGAINYVICWCRINVTTTLQASCGYFGMLFILVRILWYAHLEGGLQKADNKRPVQLAPFMGACALYGLCMSFPIENWRVEPSSNVIEMQINNVSIFNLRAPNLPQHSAIDPFTADSLFKEEGLAPSSPWLLQSIATVIAGGKNGSSVTIPCSRSPDYRSPECRCDRHGLVKFKFVYDTWFPGNQFGVIRYNYAYVVERRLVSKCRQRSTCNPSSGPLHGGYDLWFMVTRPFKQDGKKHYKLGSPASWGCDIPRPLYDPEMDPCR